MNKITCFLKVHQQIKFRDSTLNDVSVTPPSEARAVATLILSMTGFEKYKDVEPKIM